MKLRKESCQEQRDRLTKWHRWFAWHPVRVRTGYVWMAYVYRRASEASWDGYGGFIWYYEENESSVVRRMIEERA